MQYRLGFASCSVVLIAAAACAQACGHLPFDELPEPELQGGGPIAEPGPFVDSSGGLDGTVRDGTVDGPDKDGGDLFDARIPDGSVPDAACATAGDCRVIYVSPLTGKKSNPGTADRPVDTIDAGLALVSKIRNELHIASGAFNGPIKLPDQDVLLFGGFRCRSNDCEWGKDDQETVVTAANLAGGALFIGPNHTRGTIISGIHFLGAQGVIDADAAGAVTVSVIGSTPVLQHLTIEGPKSGGGASAIAKRTTAVLISGKQADPSGVLIDDCTIMGGTADAQVSGILVEDGPTLPVGGASPVLDLQTSVVTGGTAPLTYAVLLSSSGPGTIIHDNKKLQAGSAIQQTSLTDSWAISATGNVVISKNMINGSSSGGDVCKAGQSLCGGIILHGATATVVNNVVRGVVAPISTALALELTGGRTPTVIVNSNVLDGSGNGSTDGFSAAIVVRNQNTSDGTIGLVRNNIMLGGKNAKSYGVYEIQNNVASGHLAALDHNDIRGETAAYHAWFNTAPATTHDYPFVDLKNAPFTNAIDTSTTNISADCPLDSTFHLGQHSPCINAGTSIDAPSDDFERDKRPNPPGNPNGWDIGADESSFATQ